MSDREKVISTLEDIKTQTAEIGLDSAVIAHKFIDKILALLKEQEAIKPDVDSEGTCICGNCGENVGWYPAGSKEPVRLGKYCPECGKAVKWE